MDMIETVIVSLAGIAVIGLGGPRVEAIQTYAASRCQPLEQVLECRERQLEGYCVPACPLE
jgi:hypothetical protein